MPPRLIARLTLPLLVAVLGAGAVSPPTSYAEGGGEEPPPSSSLQATPHQRVGWRCCPRSCSAGRVPADADAARSPLVATVRPAREGRRVRLQVLRDGTWTTLATRRQDARGRVEMAAATSAGGQPLTYRVRVLASVGCAACPAAR